MLLATGSSASLAPQELHLNAAGLLHPSSCVRAPQRLSTRRAHSLLNADGLWLAMCGQWVTSQVSAGKQHVCQRLGSVCGSDCWHHAVLGADSIRAGRYL